MGISLLAVFSLVLPSSTLAQKVDTQKSTITIHVGKSGAFSAFGHEHTVRAPLTSGTVNNGKSKSVQISVNAKALKVVDQGDSAKDQAEVQSTMIGPKKRPMKTAAKP